MRQEIKLESKEGPALNLKTNPEETLNAMRRVEPEDWEKSQENWKTNSIQGCLRWIRGESEERESVGGGAYILYGFGGHNRWYVDRDGSIRFSKRHSRQSSLKQAEIEGFNIQ